MAKTKINWNADRLVSISAISISFITLVIFVYQTNLMSRQNYLSIMPYLMISTTNNTGEHTFELNLKNHGVGPAIMESVTLTYRDKKYDLADYDYYIYGCLVAIAPALDSLKVISSSSLDKGMAIPANTTYNVLKVTDSPEDYQLLAGTINQLLENGLQYEIVYKSIQEERWMIQNDSEGPKQLH